MKLKCVLLSRSHEKKSCPHYVLYRVKGQEITLFWQNFMHYHAIVGNLRMHGKQMGNVPKKAPKIYHEDPDSGNMPRYELTPKKSHKKAGLLPDISEELKEEAMKSMKASTLLGDIDSVTSK